MIEKKFDYTLTDQKLIEKVVDDENLHIMHMTLSKDTALPEHYANSNVYMIIVHGSMTIALNDGQPHVYTRGAILNIPFNTKMNVGNRGEETLEFFVVKVPNPQDMPPVNS